MTVSIPSRWAKDYDIKKGSEVDILEEGSSLRISVDSFVKPVKTYVSNFKKGVYAPRRAFIIPFIKGYDKIRINFEDPDIVDKVEKNLFLLTGFDIAEQGNNHIVLQNLVHLDVEKFDQYFDRLMFAGY